MPVIGFKPIGDRVLVRPMKTDEEVKIGGIIIPDTAKEKPLKGEVVAISDSKSSDADGSCSSVSSLKVGNMILFTKWGGSEVKIDGEDLLIMKGSDVLGVFSS